MPTTTDIRVNDLIINKMTQEQYDALPEKSPTELYVIEGDSNLIYAEQATTLPTASASNEGRVYQFVGTTDATYTNGYFYKCSEETAYDGTVTFAPGSESGVTLTCSAADFGAFAKRYTNDPTAIVETGFSYGSNGFMFVCTNSQEEPIVMEQDIPLLELERSGFSFSGQPVVNDGFLGTCSLTVSGGNYSWEQVNVQPAVDPLPDQTGHSGEFLTTDGTNASWAAVEALPSQTGQAGKILGTDGTNAAWETKTTISFRTWDANE